MEAGSTGSAGGMVGDGLDKLIDMVGLAEDSRPSLGDVVRGFCSLMLKGWAAAGVEGVGLGLGCFADLLVSFREKGSWD